jgi:hypothetical protein
MLNGGAGAEDKKSIDSLNQTHVAELLNTPSYILYIYIVSSSV